MILVSLLPAVVFSVSVAFSFHFSADRGYIFLHLVSYDRYERYSRCSCGTLTLLEAEKYWIPPFSCFVGLGDRGDHGPTRGSVRRRFSVKELSIVRRLYRITVMALCISSHDYD